jgi:hypothetical protein
MSIAHQPAAAAGSSLKRVGRFALHFFEMCVPMCIGFAIGDALYFWIADLAGYSDPFSELPVLSVVLVTVFMTAPMAAWMRSRGMPQRAIVEMSAVMPIIAFALLVLGAAGAVAKEHMALLEHALMMPAMLVPMLLRPGLYSTPMPHHAD